MFTLLITLSLTLFLSFIFKSPPGIIYPWKPMGNFVKKDGFPDNMITWSHISTVGQSPMTVEICCHSFEQTDGVWHGVVHS